MRAWDHETHETMFMFFSGRNEKVASIYYDGLGWRMGGSWVLGAGWWGPGCAVHALASRRPGAGALVRSVMLDVSTASSRRSRSRVFFLEA